MSEASNPGAQAAPTPRRIREIGPIVDIGVRLAAVLVLAAWCLQIVAPFVGIVLWALIIAIAADGLCDVVSRWLGNRRFDDPHASVNRLRICRFEEVESRCLMAADLHVGSVYYEQAAGDDLQPNILQFTFEGGAPGTQLTRIVIDGDKDGAGKSSGDVFFDTAPGGFGVFQSNPLKIVSHDGFQVLSTQVSDGGMTMIIDVAG